MVNAGQFVKFAMTALLCMFVDAVTPASIVRREAKYSNRPERSSGGQRSVIAQDKASLTEDLARQDKGINEGLKVD